jgi:hypothetical protein
VPYTPLRASCTSQFGVFMGDSALNGKERAMTVLQFRPPSRTRGPVGGPGGGRTGRPRVPVRGTFTAPDLTPGSMNGWLRILNCSRQGSSLRCLAVVSGTLYDARGQRLGLASTRCLLPVTIEPDERPPAHANDPSGSVLVGRLEVNLLGFQVHVAETRLPVMDSEGGQRREGTNVMPLPRRQRA